MGMVEERTREMRVLIEAGWVQGVYAFSKANEEVSPESPEACCFCLSGAARRVSMLHFGDVDTPDGLAMREHARAEFAAIRDNINATLESMGQKPSFVHFNDSPTTTKPMVLALLDNAIARAATLGL